VLARIRPALLGGEVPLDEKAARAAIDERIARPLGLGVEEAAAGIVEIIDNSMARAIRLVSVGRGHDPRRFTLVPFGGAGPLHACRLAELLDMPAVVIPPRPGVLSTWGLLDTDIRATFVRTVGTAERHAVDRPAAVPALEATWAELESQARAWLDDEHVSRERQRFERSADLRYEHQSFELTVEIGGVRESPPKPPMAQSTGIDVAQVAQRFHAEHRRLYSYDLPTARIELVNLRVTAIGQLPQRAASAPRAAGGDAASARVGERPVHQRGAGFVSTPCYARDRLAPGMTFDGPAVVDQEDATILVAPGFRARVDAATNLILERA
jgi:N-methylhydantoinase A